MGIPGAGKSRVAEEYVARGYRRLNRDERGGSLRELARRPRRRAVVRRRAGRPRQHVPDARVPQPRGRGGGTTRHPDPLRLARHAARRRPRSTSSSGCSSASARLPTPDALKQLARREPGLMAPTSQMRALRELEPPSVDEGFAERGAPCRSRAAPRADGGAGVFVAAAVLEAPGWKAAIEHADPAAPHLVFDWRPDGSPDDLAEPVALLATVVDGTGRGRAVPARRRARRSAGAGRRSRVSRSRSRERTASTPRARPSSARARRTARSRRPSAPASLSV